MAISRFAAEEVDFLSLLSDANRRRVLERSSRVVFPIGVVIEPGAPPQAMVLEHGLVRAYWTLPDGRQATLAIFHPHELLGSSTILGEPHWAFIHVIVQSTVITLDQETMQDLCTTEVEVANAVSRALIDRLRQAGRLVAVRSLGNIKERLAFDLLERCCKAQLDTGHLDVRATQSDLADSIGSSREVIARSLREFRKAGLVETGHGLVRVVSPERLARIVRAFELTEAAARLATAASG